MSFRAWRLLHNAENQKLFDTVIVISDRNVINRSFKTRCLIFSGRLVLSQLSNLKGQARAGNSQRRSLRERKSSFARSKHFLLRSKRSEHWRPPKARGSQSLLTKPFFRRPALAAPFSYVLLCRWCAGRSPCPRRSRRARPASAQALATCRITAASMPVICAARSGG